jgi:Protein of unknown function (DUF4427)
MPLNTVRFDLSNWLIHFFRNIDLESPNSIIYPEDMGWSSIHEDTKYSALFMLRSAIRHGRLWSTWSFRNNVRTIYGSSPAVCFTEMPIAAFLESGEVRASRGEAISQYALIFPKKKLFEIGANPVIYGLDNRNYQLPSSKNGGARIIAPSVLPENEQYRYVTHNPASSKPIDWSHEREWRWPYRGNYSQVEEALEEYGVVDDVLSIPGLDFYEYNIDGMGVVVKNERQAMWVAYDILTLVDRGLISKNQYKFILTVDSLPSASELRSPKMISKAITGSLVDLEPFFSHQKSELKSISERFSALVNQIESESSFPESGEPGGCWLWLLDNTSKLTRSLLENNRITISESGKYLVRLYEFSDSRSLRQRKEMTKELAKRVDSEFNLECGYFSVLNSDDPNAVPFYNDDHLDNHMYYNVSWEY